MSAEAISHRDVDTDDEDEEILLEPNCSEPLGLPLPRDEHACSVSLPSWASVVGYEEGDESVTLAMRCGYPRFMYHPLVVQLMQAVLDRHGSKVDNEDCLLLPGHAAALRCQAFLQQALEGKENNPNTDNALLCKFLDKQSTDVEQKSSSSIRIVPVGVANIHAVLFPAEAEAAMQAKAYWQHAGEIVSSRRAEQALKEMKIPLNQSVTCGPDAPYVYHPAQCKDKDTAFTRLRQRIAQWNQIPSPDSVFLTPSGMASIYAALRSARRHQMVQGDNQNNGGGRSIVFGFPYLDTLKLCSRNEVCPDGVDFFGHGNEEDLERLEQVLQQHEQSGTKVCALFTEVPSNPLLACPNLQALRELADRYDFCLIVDDTIGNCLNVDLLQTGLADAVCTSLTKIVSGRGDAMAGSLVTNPYTAKGRWMQQDLQPQQKDDSGLFPADAQAILLNSSDFEERNQQINETSEILADWLKDHPDADKVWYPKYAPLYPSLMRQNDKAGYGGLLSILLDSHVCQRSFYDTLDVAKGPSLGTNFTLVCPYTLLAHYHELEFASRYNVPPNLLRISVGLEDVDVLKDKFEKAFDQSRLYPKLQQQSSAVPNTSSHQSRFYSTSTAGLGSTTPLRQHQATFPSSTLRSVQSLLRRFPR